MISVGLAFCLACSRSRQWRIQVWWALKLTRLEVCLGEENVYKIMSQNHLQAWEGAQEGEGPRGMYVGNLPLLSPHTQDAIICAKFI